MSSDDMGSALGDGEESPSLSEEPSDADESMSGASVSSSSSLPSRRLLREKKRMGAKRAYFRPETSRRGRRRGSDDEVYRPDKRKTTALAASGGGDAAPTIPLDGDGSLDAAALLDAVKAASSGVVAHTLTGPGAPAGGVPQPAWVTGGVMKPHQLQGYAWLRRCYDAGVGGILGDEMGVGKTLQTIGLVADLAARELIGHPQPPVLLIAPLSTIANWAAEFKRFAPQVKVMEYIGDQATRRALRDDVTAHLQKLGVPVSKAALGYTLPHGIHCLLTSPDLLRLDDYFVTSFAYPLVVVDEAHRYKSPSAASIFGDPVQKHGLAHVPRRVLLTGTPMQNNLSELWSLLHIVMPLVFTDAAAFARCAPATAMACLQYAMLRRTKDVVLKELPRKNVYVMYCPMSPAQEVMYRTTLRAAAGGGNTGTPISNVVMQLRKCCCHPYLFPGVENEPFEIGEHLVINAGKLAVLDKLLAKFKREQRKVLVFSQFTSMLDIIHDYMEYRGHTFVRLDGGSSPQSRAESIHAFADPKTFAFLLSTRAGGLGLNLTQASVVVLFDSDWNPFMDLQAQDRVHRLGQTRDVDVYRLLTRGTIEDIMFARALEKIKRAGDVVEDPQARALLSAQAGKVKAVELMRILKACAADAASASTIQSPKKNNGGKAVTSRVPATPKAALLYSVDQGSSPAGEDGAPGSGVGYTSFLKVSAEAILNEAQQIVSESAAGGRSGGDPTPHQQPHPQHHREHMVYQGVNYVELVSDARVGRGEAAMKMMAEEHAAAAAADGTRSSRRRAADAAAAMVLPEETPQEREDRRRKRLAKKWGALKYTSRLVLMPEVCAYPDDAVVRYIHGLQKYQEEKATKRAAMAERTLSVISAVEEDAPPATAAPGRKRSAAAAEEADAHSTGEGGGKKAKVAAQGDGNNATRPLPPIPVAVVGRGGGEHVARGIESPTATTDLVDAVDDAAATAADAFTECYGVHYVQGDVSAPRGNHQVRNVEAHAPGYPVHITILPIDNSGDWCARGIYKAVDHNMNNSVRDYYTAAKPAQDLRLGDVHWLRPTKRAGSVVAVCVVHRAANKHAPDPLLLNQALGRLAAACDALKAAGATPIVHAPRFGLKGNEWYAVQKIFRQHFVERAPVFVHYFKK